MQKEFMQINKENYKRLLMQKAREFDDYELSNEKFISLLLECKMIKIDAKKADKIEEFLQILSKIKTDLQLSK